MNAYLGYSGIHGSVEAQMAAYPDADSRISRFAQGRDSAAALVVDGQIVAAAAEERFTGDKMTGDFPAHAIQYCLNEAGMALEDLDMVLHSFHYELDRDIREADPDLATRHDTMYSAAAQEQLFRKCDQLGNGAVTVHGVRHHIAHAHSAFDVSGFDDAAVIVSDGMGEDASLTIYAARGSEFKQLASVPASHSIGVLYSLVTYHLGFVPGVDEYKVMALAALGDPTRFAAAFADVVRIQRDGLYMIPFLAREAGRRAQDLHEGAIGRLASLLGPSRGPGEDLEQRHFDIAAALQGTLEEALLHVGSIARNLSASSSVCLAGGVALNCVANSHLASSGLFDNVFIQPAAGDDGSALGAALAGASNRCGKVGNAMREPYWGPGYTDSSLLLTVRSGVKDERCFEVLDERELTQRAASDIAHGVVLGWFQGRMEFGPRALGNRSILADPRSKKMRERVNSLIKNREGFRPLAPAVLAEEAHRYFEIPAAQTDRYRHMLLIGKVRHEYIDVLQAVVHLDGTARLQTVGMLDNTRMYRLLRELKSVIGYPVVLNTSLNVQGQPIACTPETALETAINSGLDCIYLGNIRVDTRRR